jgi:hypothetical protein
MIRVCQKTPSVYTADYLNNIKDATMTRLLKVMLILGLLVVSVGCGQKGSLYMPSQHVAQQLGL